MAKGIRFKVWKSQRATSSQQPYFFHIIGGNGEILLLSEAYPEERTAHKSVRSAWTGFAKALGAFDPKLMTLNELPPIPYTRDSLKPK